MVFEHRLKKILKIQFEFGPRKKVFIINLGFIWKNYFFKNPGCILTSNQYLKKSQVLFGPRKNNFEEIETIFGPEKNIFKNPGCIWSEKNSLKKNHRKKYFLKNPGI